MAIPFQPPPFEEEIDKCKINALTKITNPNIVFLILTIKFSVNPLLIPY